MHEHNHDCECGCGCGCEHEHDEEQMMVTLCLDDGTELECIALSIFPVDDLRYIALLPTVEPGQEEGDIYLYRFHELENGELDLQNIESDEEYERVADAFDELLDEEEFDEMFDEEDE